MVKRKRSISPEIQIIKQPYIKQESNENNNDASHYMTLISEKNLSIDALKIAAIKKENEISALRRENADQRNMIEKLERELAEEKAGRSMLELVSPELCMTNICHS